MMMLVRLKCMLNKFFSTPIFYPGSGTDASIIPLLLKYSNRFIYCDIINLDDAVRHVSAKISNMGYYDEKAKRSDCGGGLTHIRVQFGMDGQIGMGDQMSDHSFDLSRYESSYERYQIEMSDKASALMLAPRLRTVSYSHQNGVHFDILFMQCHAEIAFDILYAKRCLPFNFIVAERYYGPNFYLNGPIFKLIKATGKHPDFILTKDEEPDFDAYNVIETYHKGHHHHEHFDRKLYKRILFQ